MHVTDFIENYAILLPGRIPGLKECYYHLAHPNEMCILEYERAVRGTGHRVVAETTFHTQ